MKRLLFTLLLIGLLAGPAIAQCGPDGCDIQQAAQSQGHRTEPPQTAAMCDTVAKLSATRNSQSYNVGLGTHIGDGIVLTVAHLMRGAVESPTVKYQGKTYPAQLLEIDETNDIAILKTEAPFTASHRLADGAPVPGTPVGWQGHTGRVLNLDGMRIEVSDGSRSGDSGSCIWTTEGVVGMIATTDGRSSQGPASGAIRRLLAKCSPNRRPLVPIAPDIPLPRRVPPVRPAPTPAPDMSPILSAIDGLHQSVLGIDGRLNRLENPPAPQPKPKPDKTAVGWLAMAAGLAAGAFLFFKNQGA
mgnify:CR=1 FL=1